MQSNREKVSYCIGLESASNIKGQFKDIDSELLKKGFNDAIEGKTPSLEADEIKKILTALQQQVQEQQKAFVEEIAKKNKTEGEAFLQENKQAEGVQTLPSGLQYKVLSTGTGQVSPTLHDTVQIHYRGSLINGTVFDSSYEKEKAQEFPLSRVIAGWSEALKLMKVGDKWKIFVPSYLAYGEGGYGPQIEPNTTLVFELELVKIN